MVIISEWLPNPVGKDSEGEWVELFNDSDTPVSLAGWRLETKGPSTGSERGKSVWLGGQIKPGEYLGFRRRSIKLTLHNTDGELKLYNPQGEVVDRQVFFGKAPEGKSFARASSGFFSFTEPTFGYQNKFEIQENLVGNVYPAGALVQGSLGAGGFFGLVLGVAAVLTGLILFAVKRNENLSNLFFGRDEETWR